LGAVSGKMKNPLGGGLSNGINVAAGMGRPAATETSLRALREWKNMKIFESLTNSKNMVFNVKKLLKIGMGLTLWGKGEKKRCEWN
jgi:hypothetical protein